MSPRKFFLITFAFSLLVGSTAQAAISFFEAEVGLAISPQPEFLSVADMNNDGLDDVVVISPQSDEVNVLLSFPNQPSGFSPVGVDNFGSTLRRGEAGDVTRDGFPDLVVPDQRADGVWVLVGNGQGRLQSPSFISVGRNPFAVALGDFDGVDGADIAVTDQRLGNVTILLNDGGAPPRFRRGPIFAAGEAPEDIVTLDVDGDGNLDLVTLNVGGPRVKSISVLLFDFVTAGLPVFMPANNFTIGARPEQLNVADVNNDGRDDLVMLNRPTGGGNSEINVMINAGGGVFNSPTIFEAPCPFFTGGATCRSRALATGDFDNNGTVDLAVFMTDPRRVGTGSGIENDALLIFTGRGDGQFGQASVLRTPKTPLAAVALNLNGDGRVDLVAGFQRSTNMTGFVNASTGAGLEPGDRCVVGGDCASGFCIEGVCCLTACAPDESCAVPTREGTCERLPIDVIPCTVSDECFAFPEPEDDGICKDGFCCEDGCPDGRCDIAGFEGLCIDTQDPGLPCTDERDCSSRFCVDGVCCREACDEGFCGANADGVCRAPLPPGEPCSLDGQCDTGFCDFAVDICCVFACGDQEECAEDGLTCIPDNSGERLPGDSCDGDTICLENSQCVDGVCCTVSGCPDGEICAAPNGNCVVIPTPTPTPVPQPNGNICSDNPNECDSGNCVDLVCCNVPECDDGFFCSRDAGGTCVEGTPPPTPTPTIVPACRGVQCAGGERCVERDLAGDGVCVEECGAGLCLFGERCVENEDRNPICIPGCTDFPCDAGTSCRIGAGGDPACVIPCGNDVCLAGEVCENDPLRGPQCISSSRSGGCAVAQGQGALDVLILLLLPVTLWLLRRTEVLAPIRSRKR